MEREQDFPAPLFMDVELTPGPEKGFKQIAYTFILHIIILHKLQIAKLKLYRSTYHNNHNVYTNKPAF